MICAPATAAFEGSRIFPEREDSTACAIDAVPDMPQPHVITSDQRSAVNIPDRALRAMLVFCCSPTTVPPNAVVVPAERISLSNGKDSRRNRLNRRIAVEWASALGELACFHRAIGDASLPRCIPSFVSTDEEEYRKLFGGSQYEIENRFHLNFGPGTEFEFLSSAD